MLNSHHEALEIENTHFYINTETRPWFKRSNGDTRKAAVSAFGFGGTNFHVVLEEYNSASQPYQRLQSVSQPVLLSAETTALLLEKLKEIEHGLGNSAANEYIWPSSMTPNPIFLSKITPAWVLCQIPWKKPGSSSRIQ